MNYRLIVCVFAVLVCAVTAIEYEDDITDDSIATNAGRKKKICKSCYKNKVGSCVAAKYKSCCKTTALQSCLGEPPTCYCDTNCHILKDCCKDAHKIGCKMCKKKKKKPPGRRRKGKKVIVTQTAPTLQPTRSSPAPSKVNQISVNPANPVSAVPPTTSSNIKETRSPPENSQSTGKQSAQPPVAPTPTSQPQQPKNNQPNSATQPRVVQTSTTPPNGVTQTSTGTSPKETNTNNRPLRGGLGGVKVKQHHLIMIIIVAAMLLGIILILVCQTTQCALLLRRERPQKQHMIRKDTMPAKKEPPAPGKGQLYSSIPETDSGEENIYSEP